MNESPHRLAFTWWQPAVSIALIGILVMSLWRPMSYTPSAARSMDRARGELAPLLVAVPTTTAEIDRRLMSWSRFQQNAAVSRELTEALGLCRWSTLDDATRRDLAEQLYRLYAITPEEDGTIGLDPLRRIQRIVSMQACAPAASAAIVAAATTIARTEPQGRSNWW